MADPPPPPPPPPGGYPMSKRWWLITLGAIASVVAVVLGIGLYASRPQEPLRSTSYPRAYVPTPVPTLVAIDTPTPLSTPVAIGPPPPTVAPPTPVPPLVFSGSGSKVTDKFCLSAGPSKLSWTAKGGRDNFIVHGRSAAGADDGLVNEIPPDPSSGETVWNSPGGCGLYLEVKASSLTWSITITPI